MYAGHITQNDTYKDRINAIIRDIDGLGILDIDWDIEVNIPKPTMTHSNFIVTQQQGEWAERLVLQAINERGGEFFALPYGKNDHISADDPNFSVFFNAYQVELNEIGKRPDILVFRKRDFPNWKDLTTARDDAQMVNKAVAALEVRCSAFLADKHKNFNRQRKAMYRDFCDSVRFLLLSPDISPNSLVLSPNGLSQNSHSRVETFLNKRNFTALIQHFMRLQAYHGVFNPAFINKDADFYGDSTDLTVFRQSKFLYFVFLLFVVADVLANYYLHDLDNVKKHEISPNNAEVRENLHKLLKRFIIIVLLSITSSSWTVERDNEGAVLIKRATNTHNTTQKDRPNAEKTAENVKKQPKNDAKRGQNHKKIAKIDNNRVKKYPFLSDFSLKNIENDAFYTLVSVILAEKGITTDAALWHILEQNSTAIIQDTDTSDRPATNLTTVFFSPFARTLAFIQQNNQLQQNNNQIAISKNAHLITASLPYHSYNDNTYKVATQTWSAIYRALLAPLAPQRLTHATNPLKQAPLHKPSFSKNTQTELSFYITHTLFYEAVTWVFNVFAHQITQAHLLLKTKHTKLYHTLLHTPCEQLAFNRPAITPTNEAEWLLRTLLLLMKESYTKQQAFKPLSITPRFDDFALVNRWIQRFNVPHFYVQVFFDRAYILSFEQILNILLEQGKKTQARPGRSTQKIKRGRLGDLVINGDVKNRGKTTIKIPLYYSRVLIDDIKMPELIYQYKISDNGRVITYPIFKNRDDNLTLHTEVLEQMLSMDS